MEPPVSPAVLGSSNSTIMTCLLKKKKQILLKIITEIITSVGLHTFVQQITHFWKIVTLWHKIAAQQSPGCSLHLSYSSFDVSFNFTTSINVFEPIIRGSALSRTTCLLRESRGVWTNIFMHGNNIFMFLYLVIHCFWQVFFCLYCQMSSDFMSGPLVCHWSFHQRCDSIFESAPRPTLNSPSSSITSFWFLPTYDTIENQCHPIPVLYHINYIM